MAGLHRRPASLAGPGRTGWGGIAGASWSAPKARTAPPRPAWHKLAPWRPGRGMQTGRQHAGLGVHPQAATLRPHWRGQAGPGLGLVLYPLHPVCMGAPWARDAMRTLRPGRGVRGCAYVGCSLSAYGSPLGILWQPSHTRAGPRAGTMAETRGLQRVVCSSAAPSPLG